MIIEGKARMSLFFLTDFVFLKVDLDKLILLSENKVQSGFFFPSHVISLRTTSVCLLTDLFLKEHNPHVFLTKLIIS